MLELVDGNIADGPLRIRGREATEREALAEWVGREILPHERDLRRWLQRRLVDAGDVEDVVQECYCRLAQLRDVSHVTMPRAYLFTMARNLVQRQRKRARVVRLEAMADPVDEQWEIELLSPERIAAARQELGRVQAALATVSERARRIFLMRKVEGLSQKEIAQTLGVTEAVVENEASRSLRAILKLLTEPEAGQDLSSTGGVSRARSR
ncbi:RNA polymerase sigma factor [Sphingomonas cannabina]|uniref:RNA polymerase sigma factor n=1 Tax=Sphingomonas cannabina TaxID=2899123 RepID=UPI001F1F6DFA|nr:RNA polymerase sigma factor [Sphingomonas cannabina]UIJ43521.1 RNA polymerase sigma factor [Sphingomonas cannabina]